MLPRLITVFRMAYYLSYFRVAKKFYCSVKFLMGLVPLVIIANTFIYVLLFSKPRAKVITLDEIPDYLVPVPSRNKLNYSKTPVCSIMLMATPSVLPSPEQYVSDTMLEKIRHDNKVEEGGVWKPKECVSRYKVAIVIPYRARLTNLKDFLAYMHPFLQRQLLEYRIIVVEQTSKRPFNRAKLFNIGFKEAEKIEDYHCYIFHDVDLIPQNPNNIYACTALARHMSANIDVFDYKVPYDQIIGGAVAILKKRFTEVNGFSNTFFGWGGEDDDFYNRVTRNGSKICRFAPEVSQYIMLSHKKQKPSADRYYFLLSGKERFDTDGLNSLKYTVLVKEMLPLYTRILVDI